MDLDDIGEGDLGVLQRGEADVYIDHLEHVPPDVATLRIGTLRAFVVLPARHRLARARSLRLRELEGEAFVAYSGDRRARDLQLRALAVHDVRPSRLVGASSSDTILSLVAAGLGFSIVPSLPDGPNYLGVASWPLGEPATDFRVLAAWRRRVLGPSARDGVHRRGAARAAKARAGAFGRRARRPLLEGWGKRTHATLEAMQVSGGAGSFLRPEVRGLRSE